MVKGTTTLVRRKTGEVTTLSNTVLVTCTTPQDFQSQDKGIDFVWNDKTDI